MATIFRRSMVKDERLSDNILFWKGFAKNVLCLNFCSTARLFDVMFLKCQSRKTSDEPTKAHTVALSAMNVKIELCVSDHSERGNGDKQARGSHEIFLYVERVCGRVKNRAHIYKSGRKARRTKRIEYTK